MLIMFVFQMCNSEKVWQIVTEKRLKRNLYKDELKSVELSGWRRALKDIMHRKRNEKNVQKQITSVVRSVKNNIKATESSEIKNINSQPVLNNQSKILNIKKTDKNLFVEKNILSLKSAVKNKSSKICKNINNLKANISATAIKSEKKLPSTNINSVINSCKNTEKNVKK